MAVELEETEGLGTEQEDVDVEGMDVVDTDGGVEVEIELDEEVKIELVEEGSAEDDVDGGDIENEGMEAAIEVVVDAVGIKVVVEAVGIVGIDEQDVTAGIEAVDAGIDETGSCDTDTTQLEVSDIDSSMGRVGMEFCGGSGSFGASLSDRMVKTGKSNSDSA